MTRATVALFGLLGFLGPFADAVAVAAPPAPLVRRRVLSGGPNQGIAPFNRPAGQPGNQLANRPANQPGNQIGARIGNRLALGGARTTPLRPVGPAGSVGSVGPVATVAPIDREVRRPRPEARPLAGLEPTSPPPFQGGRSSAVQGQTVVVDAGHGGSNLGAPGLLVGNHEKRLTLRLARALRRRLADDGVRVTLTREHDEYLTLGERVRRANGAGAALFVSLHANASPDHNRRGVETYVAARDLVEVAVARAGADDDPVRSMTARAEARLRAAESLRLAVALDNQLVTVRPGPHAVRQAPYDVLDGVTTPAALIEFGYIDHPVEGPELEQEQVVDGIADAIARAILEYLTHADTTLASR